MSEGDLLYRAILAAPADDAPRLVYADWLEERGELERAEIIRQMIHFPRDRAGYRPPRPASLYWPDAPSWAGYGVRRGFVAEIELTTPLFLAHAADLFARQPITAVRLTDRSAHLVGSRGVIAVLASGPVLDTTWYRPVALYPGAAEGTELVFPDERRAFLALSERAVAVGRRAAGLPSLK